MARRVSAATERRRDQWRTQGYEAAMAGLPQDAVDVEHGSSDNVFAALAGLEGRASWLIGYERGQRDLQDYADDAVRLLVASDPIAAAALAYADVCEVTSILKDPERRAVAAKVLVDAIRAGWRAASTPTCPNCSAPVDYCAVCGAELGAD